MDLVGSAFQTGGVSIRILYRTEPGRHSDAKSKGFFEDQSLRFDLNLVGSTLLTHQWFRAQCVEGVSCRAETDMHTNTKKQCEAAT